ncbi:MAG: TolC family protein, partial [Algoriphagus sp.]
MKKGTLLLLAILCMTGVWAQAQETLDLEKALQMGLENNLQVKIGVENRNLRELDTKIAAGNLFMPTLNANYLRTFSTEDVTQTFVSDPNNPRQIDAAKSRNKAYSVVGIYGFRPESLVTIRRLGMLEEISDLDARVIVG